MPKFLTLAALLCSATILPAQTKNPPEPDYAQFEKKITGGQEILHALNRLTFGPKPGDVEAVKDMGLSKWIDLQLHPDRIPESEALEKLVEPLVEPASIQEMLRVQMGTNGVARGVMIQNGNITVTTTLPGAQLQQLITQAQINTLRTGTDKEGLEILNALPKEKVVQVLATMPAVRPRLLPYLDTDLRKKVEAAVPVPVQAGDTLAQGKLFRAIKSDRQLEEVLVDFWYNHFNVDASKGTARFLVTDYEYDAIRPHVLGRFRDLLGATANSAAMMFYLDNWRSSSATSTQSTGGLNENYARELMELHTLGVDGGYTQKDIVEVARCFTGWTLNNSNPGGGAAARLILLAGGANNGPAQTTSFLYNDVMHDKGEKVVLGVTIPAGGGKDDGEKVLDILARHPSTAKFISKELAQRFVADDPPPALISRMVQTFRETDGDIRAVLTTLFSSKEFLSEGSYHAKLKTPLEMVVSAVRATGAEAATTTPLVREIATLGQPLYRKLEPTGYSNRGSNWMSAASLLERMNFSLQLGQSQIEGITFDSEKLSDSPATLARQLLSADPDKQTMEAITDAIHFESESAKGSQQGLIAGMVIGSPDFQKK
jgi:uncharacterized protein (DUF1800 family)